MPIASSCASRTTTRGTPVAADRVSLRFAALDDPGVEPTGLALAAGPGNTYVGSGANMSFDGRWQVVVLVERGGGSVEIPLELETQLAPRSVTVQRPTGQSAIVHGGSLARGADPIPAEPERPARPGSQIECFDFIGDPRIVDSMIVTIASRAADGQTRQVPVQALARGRFVADVTLATGVNTLAAVAHTPDGTRIRAKTVINIPRRIRLTLRAYGCVIRRSPRPSVSSSFAATTFLEVEVRDGCCSSKKETFCHGCHRVPCSARRPLRRRAREPSCASDVRRRSVHRPARRDRHELQIQTSSRRRSPRSPHGQHRATVSDANVLTFNGTIPGPKFRLNVGDTVIVHFKNNIAHATGIHWHGIELANESDGTPLTQNMVPPGGTYLYKFKVTRPGVYWYHPHHHSSTNQVFKGLYGIIIVTEHERRRACRRPACSRRRRPRRLRAQRHHGVQGDAGQRAPGNLGDVQDLADRRRRQSSSVAARSSVRSAGRRAEHPASAARRER